MFLLHVLYIDVQLYHGGYKVDCYDKKGPQVRDMVADFLLWQHSVIGGGIPLCPGFCDTAYGDKGFES